MSTRFTRVGLLLVGTFVASSLAVPGAARAAESTPTSIDVPDPTYGVNGSARLVSSEARGAIDPVVDAQGRVYGGEVDVEFDVGSIRSRFSVTRVDADGVRLPDSPEVNCSATSCDPDYLGVDGSGRLVMTVAEWVNDNRPYDGGDPFIHRLSASGTAWDTTYGGTGSVPGTALAVNPDGSVIRSLADVASKLTPTGAVASGFAIADPVPATTRLVALPGGGYLGCQGELDAPIGCSRYTSTGALDSGWGVGGRIAKGVLATRRTDGAIAVVRGVGSPTCSGGTCAYADHDVVLVSAAGSVSATFGAGGAAPLEAGPARFVGATDGQQLWVVLGGGIVHLLGPTGAPVTALAGDGTYDVRASARGAAVAADGSLYVTAAETDVASILVRLRPSGSVEDRQIYGGSGGDTVLAQGAKVFVSSGASVQRYDPAAPPAVGFRSLRSPVRLIDTRHPLDGPALEPGVVRRFTINDEIGLPADPAGTALNVTVTNTSATGYVKAWACSATTDPPPATSIINYAAGQTVANSVVLDADDATRRLCVVASSRVSLVVDATGYFATDVNAVPPARLLDTRTGGTGTIERPGGSIGADRTAPLAAEVTNRFVITGTAGLPGDPAGVALNLTAVGADVGGYVKAWPCASAASSPPATSAMSYGTTPVANATFMDPDDATGGVCVRASSRVHLIIDVTGFSPARHSSLPSPVRLLDTRPGATGAIERPGGSLGRDRAVPLVADGVHRFVVTNEGGIPQDPAGMVVGIVLPPAGSGGAGYLRVWPCTTRSTPPPAASVANFRPGATASNTILIDPDPSGGICVRSSASRHLILDTPGFFPAP